jgi:HAD superfamily hydrolase (TIGR01509 family)
VVTLSHPRTDAEHPTGVTIGPGTERPVNTTVPDGFRFRAVVFACDGTLVDTTPCVHAAVATVLSRRALTGDEHLYHSTCGMPLATVTALVAARLRAANLAADPDVLAAELLTAVVDALPDRVRPLRGAHEVVARTAREVPVAIAANTPRRLLDATLRHSGLADLTTTVLAAEDAAAPRPAPDLHLAACHRLNVPPHHTIAVEDSPAGIRAARTAGLHVIGIGPQARPATPHTWLPHLHHLPTTLLPTPAAP